jgi:RNA polymerase sigma-70 factor (ECF subfamily)
MPRTLSAVFAEHVAFVWRVLARHGVPERLLEEGCKAVFVSLQERLAELEGRASLRPWLYGVATEQAQRMPRTAVSMEGALSILNEDEREVFALAELEGMTSAEVSAALGVSEHAVLSSLDAARERLQRPHAAFPANRASEPSAAQRARMISAIEAAAAPSLGLDLARLAFRRPRLPVQGWIAMLVALGAVLMASIVGDCGL